jgi:hypothetical protein
VIVLDLRLEKLRSRKDPGKEAGTNCLSGLLRRVLRNITEGQSRVMCVIVRYDSAVSQHLQRLELAQIPDTVGYGVECILIEVSRREWQTQIPSVLA